MAGALLHGIVHLAALPSLSQIIYLLWQHACSVVSFVVLTPRALLPARIAAACLCVCTLMPEQSGLLSVPWTKLFK